jgi:uncharacterized protein YrrD
MRQPDEQSQQPAGGAQPIPPAQSDTWVTLSQLRGMPLVDLATGRKLGTVERVLLSVDYHTVAAFTVPGGVLRKGKAYPAGDATIGADAITLRVQDSGRGSHDNFDNLPTADRLISMRLLTETGRVVGQVVDMRIDPTSHTVLGYEVWPVDEGLLSRLLRHETRVVPTAAIERHGVDALIVPEAVARQYLGDWV